MPWNTAIDLHVTSDIESGFSINNSIAFESDNSTFLSNSFATGSLDKRQYTISLQVKRVKLSSNQYLFGVNTSTNPSTIYFNSSDQLVIQQQGNNLISRHKFRDVTAHYHLVLSFDIDNATASERGKIYVNGVEITDFTSDSRGSWSGDGKFFNGSYTTYIGQHNSANYFKGIISEVYIISAQTLTAGSFGTSSESGIWRPKEYIDFNFNDTYLNFSNSADYGEDSSGNGNNYTGSGFTVLNQLSDTQTSNLNNWSYIDVASSNAANLLKLGATKIARTTTASNKINNKLSLPCLGKGYCEIEVENISGTSGVAFGYCLTTHRPSIDTYTGTDIVWMIVDGDLNVDGTNYPSHFTALVSEDVIGLAWDATTGKVWMAINNTWINEITDTNAGNPAAGTFPLKTYSESFIIAFRDTTVAGTFTTQLKRETADFTYSPPSGFSAMNTEDVTASSITKGSTYFDVGLYTGTGTSHSITGLAFQPNLIYIKSRNASRSGMFFDSVRGVNKGLKNNTGNAEFDDSNTLTSFDSGGFSLGDDSSSRGVNVSAENYVSYLWREGVTPGMDIVSYTGTGSAHTESHSLGVKPDLIIITNRTDATGDNSWPVYINNSIAGATKYNSIDAETALTTDSTVWNDVEPTTSVFSVGTSIKTNNSGKEYIAYLFTSIRGFSKFDTYVGTSNSTYSPVVFCGFRPKFVLIKPLNFVQNWFTLDTTRTIINPNSNQFAFESTSTEAGINGAYNIDFLSYGFKLRNSSGYFNVNNITELYIAFAEYPFGGSGLTASPAY